MMLADFLVTIGAAGVRVFDGHGKKEWQADYPAGVVENLEVKDQEAFKKWWADLLKKLAVHKKRVLLIMGESTLFYKKVGDESESEAFFKEVPLIPEHIAKDTVKTSEGMLAIAANRQLFELTMPVWSENKCYVAGIYPEVLFPVKQAAEINKLSGLPAAGDLLKRDISMEKDDETAERPNKKPVLKYLAGAAIVLLAPALVWEGYVKLTEKPPSKTPVSPVTVPAKTPLPEPTVTVTPETGAKPDIKTVKVLVLNNSGITGKAKEVSEYLTNLGYGAVQTGNLPDATYSGMVIKVKTDRALAEKLFADLSENYNVATPEMNWKENPGVDAVVIIGNN
jgi:hypothetical protein